MKKESSCILDGPSSKIFKHHSYFCFNYLCHRHIASWLVKWAKLSGNQQEQLRGSFSCFFSSFLFFVLLFSFAGSPYNYNLGRFLKFLVFLVWNCSFSSRRNFSEWEAFLPWLRGWTSCQCLRSTSVFSLLNNQNFPFWFHLQGQILEAGFKSLRI